MNLLEKLKAIHDKLPKEQWGASEYKDRGRDEKSHTIHPIEWETDMGCPDYGVTMDVAEGISDLRNLLPEIIEQIWRLEELCK